MTLEQKIEKAIRHCIFMLFDGDKEDVEIGTLTILEMFCSSEKYKEIEDDWNSGNLSSEEAISKYISDVK